MPDLDYNEQQLRTEIEQVAERMQHLERIMPAIGQRLVSSVEENFMVGGRFTAVGSGEFEGGAQRWKPSKRAARTSGQTLVNKGLLAGSIHAISSGLSVIVGTNRRQAAILHYGGYIRHPGGTAYIILGRRSGKDRSRAVGMARFVKNSKVEELEAAGRKVKRTRPHVIHIDAHPFLVIQPDDYEYIGELVYTEALAITGT